MWNPNRNYFMGVVGVLVGVNGVVIFDLSNNSIFCRIPTFQSA